MPAVSRGLLSRATGAISGMTGKASSPPAAGVPSRLVNRRLTSAPLRGCIIRPSGMTCPRREAGARRPAPPAPASSTSAESRHSSDAQPLCRTKYLSVSAIVLPLIGKPSGGPSWPVTSSQQRPNHSSKSSMICAFSCSLCWPARRLHHGLPEAPGRSRRLPRDFAAPKQTTGTRG